ncbi:MAG: tagaturonate reductase [Cyclobacteriaceae bacterium]|nr:tagaturonate reductase [Cyclobacteriaceae bacterium]
MKVLNRETTGKQEQLPLKVLQFGKGNFLRAFADYMIDVLNEEQGFNAGIAVVQPATRSKTDILTEQDGLYHLIHRGLQQGKTIDEKRLITCIQESIIPYTDSNKYLSLADTPDIKIMISNTTEAGIDYQNDDIPPQGQLARTFPGKLTQWLKRRFDFFKGSKESGLVFLPCELIEDNGLQLKSCILKYADLWGYATGFTQWINDSNYFANSLVDGIVPGFPKDDIEGISESLGYDDKLVVTAEPYHLWVIEGPEEVKNIFPAHRAGFNVIHVDDLSPYRLRKVKILNGAHTCMTALGLLARTGTVREFMENEHSGPFMRSLINEEIIPTIAMPADDLKIYANEVVERFLNPFIHHELKSISLNSIAKFKVRVLPTIKDFISTKGHAPEKLCLAFAGLIQLYMDGITADPCPLNDSEEVLTFFRSLAKEEFSSDKLVESVLGNTNFWGEDLNRIDILPKVVMELYKQLKAQGATLMMSSS